MAFEFDLETLNDNLDSFGLCCPESDEFVQKLEELCKAYRKSSDDISDDIVSVMNNAGKKRVDLNVLATLEESLESQSKKVANTPRSVKKPARVPLAERSGFKLSGAGDDEKDNLLNIQTSTSAKLEGHFFEFSPFPDSPANEKFLRRPDPGHVISTIRGKKYQESGLTSVMNNAGHVELISKQPNPLYGGDKSSVIIEAKARRMEDFALLIQNKFEEIVDWGNPLIPSVDMVYTYGQVVHDYRRDVEKFGEHSVALMINDEDGTMVRLDLSKLTDDVTLFPGEIVAVRGLNETGEELVVDQIFTVPPLPATKIETNTTKTIWFACGPFTTMDNCGYEHLCELLDRVVSEKPDILIMTGPFVDRKNSYINKPNFPMTSDDLMEDLMMKIKGKLNNTKTEVIIQPSASNDLCLPPIFPSPPFLFKKLDSVKKRILFVPDPCILSIGKDGIQIAMTSSEPIQGLSNSEFHRSSDQENLDRLARLSGHLLTQQSIYPLEPTELPTSMTDLLEVGRFHSSPHIVFAPSRLAPSAKNVNQTVFVNSSTLAKGPTGNYVKMSINIPAGELGPNETVANYSNIQLLRI